jgi:hypothetical protein
MTLVFSLVVVGLALFAVSAAGWVSVSALFPASPRFRLERLGWSYAMGCALLILCVPPALALRVPAGVVLVVLVFAAIVFARRFRLSGDGANVERIGAPVLLVCLVVVAVAVYALRALTEPMWANDFIAIWGLKGKTIFGARGLPDRFFGSSSVGYSHPEYPVGLPLLYAGLSFVTGRWDDHAMALLFPLFQVATLLVVVGWLRRRGVSPAAAGLAAATVAWFEPLYSGFLTGMAEVPLAFGMLLFGTALADALEEADPGALRRLVLTAALMAATKNEGLFLAVAGAVLALIFGKGRTRWKAALAAIGPAALVRVLHFPWRSRVPLADFEWERFSIDHVWDSIAAAILLLGWRTWAGLALVVVLIALGSRVPAGNRLLLLAACAVTAYLVIPAFAVRGPAWLIETTFLRTTAALVPLAAAGIAARFRDVAGSAAVPGT